MVMQTRWIWSCVQHQLRLSEAFRMWRRGPGRSSLLAPLAHMWAQGLCVLGCADFGQGVMPGNCPDAAPDPGAQVLMVRFRRQQTTGSQRW